MPKYEESWIIFIVFRRVAGTRYSTNKFFAWLMFPYPNKVYSSAIDSFEVFFSTHTISEGNGTYTTNLSHAKI